MTTEAARANAEPLQCVTRCACGAALFLHHPNDGACDMEAAIAFAVTTAAAWMLEKIMDHWFDRWQNRRPMPPARWRRLKHQFHFWSAVAFSAWATLVAAIYAAQAALSPKADPAHIGGMVAFAALAAVMANVARIRRRKLRR